MPRQTPPNRSFNALLWGFCWRLLLVAITMPSIILAFAAIRAGGDAATFSWLFSNPMIIGGFSSTAFVSSLLGCIWGTHHVATIKATEHQETQIRAEIAEDRDRDQQMMDEWHRAIAMQQHIMEERAAQEAARPPNRYPQLMIGAAPGYGTNGTGIILGQLGVNIIHKGDPENEITPATPSDEDHTLSSSPQSVKEAAVVIDIPHTSSLSDAEDNTNDSTQIFKMG